MTSTDQMDKDFLRALVRDEAADVAKSVGVLDVLLEDAKKLIGGYFGRSRRLSSQGFIDLVSQIDSTITAEIQPVRRKISVRKPTMARPKSEARELFYLFALPEDRAENKTLYRLTSLRVLATRKKVVLEIVPLHLAIRKHAAARFIERGADSIRAVRLLAASISEWAVLPSVVEDVIEGYGNDRLAIPCRSTGMLMGYMDATESIPEGKRYTFDKEFFYWEAITASPLAPPTFIVNTYIGRSEIQDNQIGSFYVMEDWRRLARGDFDQACEAIIWPNRELEPVLNAELEEDLCDRIRREIVEPRMLRAMGNKLRELPEDEDNRKLHDLLSDRDESTVIDADEDLADHEDAYVPLAMSA
jgi:hypothetical protein